MGKPNANSCGILPITKVKCEEPKKEIRVAKAIATRFELYQAAQRKPNSRLPAFTRKEWNLKADKNGIAIVLYYSDGSIGLKRPE